MPYETEIMTPDYSIYEHGLVHENPLKDSAKTLLNGEREGCIFKFKENEIYTWGNDRDRFYELIERPDIKAKYQDKYIAVYQSNIIDFDDDEIILMERILRERGDFELFIGFVGEEKIAKIHTPRKG